MVQKLETHTSSDRLNKILFVNDSVGYMVGGQRFDNSTILKTYDSGKTWTYKNIPEAPKELFNICQSPGGKLYAIGFDGKLLISDNGNDWVYHQLWYLPYKDIGFYSNDKAAVIGGVSFIYGYRTIIDSSGSFQHYDSLNYEMNDIEMVSNQTGFIAGYGVVLKTDDSGKNWQFLNINGDNFTAIHAYGINNIWISGYSGSIFHSTDGGENWERKRNGNDLTKPHYKLLDILFTDATHGYAIGEDGLLIYTDDGGDHWMEFEKFTSNALRSIVALKNGYFIVCGDNGTAYRIHPQPLD